MSKDPNVPIIELKVLDYLKIDPSKTKIGRAHV